MKNLTLIYCGEDSDAATALAAKLRTDNTDNKVILRSTEYFGGPEEAQRVIIMPDVPFFRAMPIKEAYPKAEYEPPDEFTAPQVKKAFGALVEFSKTLTADDILELAKPLANEIADNLPPPKKRGWPKGKPRKPIAA